MSDRPFILTSNKNVPQVQEPVADLGSLLTTVKSLKQGVESLGGYRGELPGRAVTFNDLTGLGLIPPTSPIDIIGGHFKFISAVATHGSTAPVEAVAGAHEVVVMLTGAGAATVTLPTADEIITATPFWFIGGIYRLRICNLLPGAITLAPGVGVTITGLAVTNTNTWREYLIRYISPGAVDFRDIGSGNA